MCSVQPLVVLATASILVLPYVLLQSLDLGLSYAAYISHPRLRFDVSILLIAPLICFFVSFRCFVDSSFLLSFLWTLLAAVTTVNSTS